METVLFQLFTRGTQQGPSPAVFVPSLLSLTRWQTISRGRVYDVRCSLRRLQRGLDRLVWVSSDLGVA